MIACPATSAPPGAWLGWRRLTLNTSPAPEAVAAAANPSLALSSFAAEALLISRAKPFEVIQTSITSRASPTHRPRRHVGRGAGCSAATRRPPRGHASLFLVSLCPVLSALRPGEVVDRESCLAAGRERRVAGGLELLCDICIRIMKCISGATSIRLEVVEFSWELNPLIAIGQHLAKRKAKTPLFRRAASAVEPDVAAVRQTSHGSDG